MSTRAATLLIALLATLGLSGCGLWGDTDAEATPLATDSSESTVRITSGDRWFDVTIDDDDRATPTTARSGFVDEIARGISDLGVEASRPADAAVVFDGSAWVATPDIAGAEPDPAAVAAAAIAAADGAQIPIQFSPVTPELTTAEAAGFADELNARTTDGIMLSIEDQQASLPRTEIGPATTVTHDAGRWDVSVDWDALKRPVARLFPDVGAEGGEATFAVLEPDDDEEPPTVHVVPGRPATVCCGPTSAHRIERALVDELEVVRLDYDFVESEQGTAWARDLGISERVGTFTTRYTPGQNRVINIRRFGDLLQGAIIEPGETLSLNEYVGRRTTEKGFVPAGTIINGHLVDSVGGGISQFATTIFNAAFFAGLEFETYQSHSIYFSRYPYGREATISWPAPDLKIHNPTPYGVLIWPTSTSRSITVDIFSTEWAPGEQTGQFSRPLGEACTRVTTERTRTWVEDGRTETDTFIATYRPEGIACDGTETENPDEEQIEKLEEGEDPEFENGGDGIPPEEQPNGSTTTTSTTAAPTTTSTTTTSTTTSTTSSSTTTTTTSSSTTTTTTEAPTTSTTTTTTTEAP